MSPRIIGVPLGQDGALAALVAHFAVDPTCPDCGGPASLTPGPAGAVDVRIDHRDGCKGVTEGQNRRSDA
jgi:hypothetical protein